MIALRACARVLRRRAAMTMSVVALVCVTCVAPASAVDRSLGAQVAKPLITGLPWTADATTRVAHDLDTLLDTSPTLHGAHVGLLVLDTRSGNVVYERHADDAFMPASTFKLLTGSVALAMLRPGYRFHTEAWLDPQNAALYIRAGGDPLLRSADLDAMARAVRKSGVATLRSGVFIDPSAFESAVYPPGWSWDDLAYDYAAPVSAATTEENVVHITVTPGAAVGSPASIRTAPSLFDLSPEVPIDGCALAPALSVSSRATTAVATSTETPDIAGGPGACIVVTGSIPLGAPAVVLDAAVTRPVWYMRELAFHAVRGAGIDATRLAAIGGGAPAADGAASAPPGSRVVWTNDGEPLGDLLADMWWPSDNLVAELLLRAIGAKRGGLPGTTENGAVAERAWLASIGIDPATITIADGSGLSAYDRITPRALVAILQTDWNGPDRDLVLDDLPLAGVRGTLAKSFPGSLAERRTFAKTGSVNHTRGLAGYLATLHHGALTFAWSVDDWMGTNADLDALRARVLSRLIGD